MATKKVLEIRWLRGQITKGLLNLSENTRRKNQNVKTRSKQLRDLEDVYRSLEKDEREANQ